MKVRFSTAVDPFLCRVNVSWHCAQAPKLCQRESFAACTMRITLAKVRPPLTDRPALFFTTIVLLPKKAR